VGAREALAEDAVQETIERALRGHSSFDPEKGGVSAWLHGILINVLRNQSRALSRQPIQPPTDGHAWEALAASLPKHVDEVAAQIDAAVYLSRLPDDHRTILHMRYWQELSYEEIASQLGISPANARVRLSRALGAAKLVAGANREEDGR